MKPVSAVDEGALIVQVSVSPGGDYDHCATLESIRCDLGGRPIFEVRLTVHMHDANDDVGPLTVKSVVLQPFDGLDKTQ